MTGQLLLIGIKIRKGVVIMNRVQELLNMHLEMQFPKFSNNENIAEWVEDLAEFQGYFVGPVTSGNIKILDTKIFNEMKERLYKLNVIEESEQEEILYCKRYFKQLEDLRIEAMKSQS